VTQKNKLNPENVGNAVAKQKKMVSKLQALMDTFNNVVAKQHKATFELKTVIVQSENGNDKLKKTIR